MHPTPQDEKAGSEAAFGRMTLRRVQAAPSLGLRAPALLRSCLLPAPAACAALGPTIDSQLRMGQNSPCSGRVCFLVDLITYVPVTPTFLWSSKGKKPVFPLPGNMFAQLAPPTIHL